MRNTLETPKEFYSSQLQKDKSGKGKIIRNSDGEYIAHLSNKRIVTARTLKKLAEEIEYWSKYPARNIPDYKVLLNQPRPKFFN